MTSAAAPSVRPRPSDARCPFCHDAIGGDGVACAACSAPHHVECWTELDRCAVCQTTARAPAPVQEQEAFEAGPLEVLRVLEPGERLLWSGRPGPQRHAWPGRTGYLGFDRDLSDWGRAVQRVQYGLVAVVVVMLLLGFMEIASGVGFVVLLLGLLVLATGGVTHPEWVRYAITDRRVLMVGATVESLQFAELSAVEVEPSRPGRPGRSVRFWRRSILPRAPHLRFDVMGDDAPRIHALARAARRSAQLRRRRGDTPVVSP